MGKQMEGDNRQRRARAKDARDEGRAPSADGVTTGASVQERHLAGNVDHDERIAGPGWGKQQPERAAPNPRPGSLRDRESVTGKAPPAATPTSDREVRRGQGDLDDDEQRVFEAVVRQELHHGSSSLPEAADGAGLPRPDAEAALRRLVDHHDVVQQLSDDPDGAGFGPRYRVKTRV